MSRTPPRLSIAIPLHNEEASIEELLRRTLAVLDALPGGPHEMVLVDDGSSDRTPEHLAAAAARDPRIVVVHLSRNFGHQNALTAALDFATGDAVICMDGDLQDEPENIPRLVDGYLQGFDVVYAVRVKRKERLALRLSYAAFYRLMTAFSDIAIPMDAGDFGLISRRALDQILKAGERNRYLRGLRAWVGFRQLAIEVERAPRFGGRTKYGLGSLIRLAADGLFAFSTAPLKAVGLVGIVSMAAALLWTLYAVAVRFFLGGSPPGFTAVIVTITFFAGLQMTFLGVIGEYVGRIYRETKQRPTYVVREIVGRAGDGIPPRTGESSG